MIMDQTRDVLVFAIFIALYLMTMGVFLHGSVHFISNVFGFFVMAWGVFALLRCLWFSETLFLLRTFDKETNAASDAGKLPWMIVNRMQIQRRVKSGFSALRFLGPYLMIWIALGGVFLCWAVVTSFSPKDVLGFVVMDQKIAAFFQNFTDDAAMPAAPDIMAVVMVCGQIFMTACAFFIAQSFASRRVYGDVSFIIITLSFAVSMILPVLHQAMADPMPFFVYNLWHGYGIGNFDLYQMSTLAEHGDFSAGTLRVVETGMSGQVFLSFLALFTACVFIRAWVEDKTCWAFALGGLVVLALMSLADIYFAAHFGSSDAIWLSGWSLIALLWHKAMYKSGSRYQLFQK